MGRIESIYSVIEIFSKYSVSFLPIAIELLRVAIKSYHSNKLNAMRRKDSVNVCIIYVISFNYSASIQWI